MQKKLLTIIIALFLAGCNTTGGMVGNLLPVPKFLKGEIKNNTYYSKDKSFDIASPYKEGTPHFTYMEIKEQYYQQGAYVSFKTSRDPDMLYRVEIGKRLNKNEKSPELLSVVNLLLPSYKKQLQGYGSEAQEIWRAETKIDNKKAILVVLKQGENSNQKHHAIYFLNAKTGGGVVWVQIGGGCLECESKSEKELLLKNSLVNNFISSFKLNL